MFFTVLTIFGTSFVLALSGAMMPGPLLTVTVAESGRRGLAAGPLMILGHGLLEFALVLALLAGLAPLLVRDEVFIVISLVGGLVLFWMGISMFRSLPDLHLVVEANGGQRNLVLAGIVLSAVNPYWIIWWGSIGLGYILHSLRFGFMGVISFFLGHLAGDLFWYGVVSFGVTRGKHLMSDRIYQRLVGGCACFLFGFGGWFIASGIRRALEFRL